MSPLAPRTHGRALTHGRLRLAQGAGSEDAWRQLARQRPLGGGRCSVRSHGRLGSCPNRSQPPRPGPGRGHRATPRVAGGCPPRAPPSRGAPRGSPTSPVPASAAARPPLRAELEGAPHSHGHRAGSVTHPPGRLCRILESPGCPGLSPRQPAGAHGADVDHDATRLRPARPPHQARPPDAPSRSALSEPLRVTSAQCSAPRPWVLLCAAG